MASKPNWKGTPGNTRRQSGGGGQGNRTPYFGDRQLARRVEEVSSYFTFFHFFIHKEGHSVILVSSIPILKILFRKKECKGSK